MVVIVELRRGTMSTNRDITTWAIRRGRRYVAVHVHREARHCFAYTHALERRRSGRTQAFVCGIDDAALLTLVESDAIRAYPSLAALRADVLAEVVRMARLDRPATSRRRLRVDRGRTHEDT